MEMTEEEAKTKWCPQAGRALVVRNAEGEAEVALTGRESTKVVMGAFTQAGAVQVLEAAKSHTRCLFGTFAIV